MPGDIELSEYTADFEATWVKYPKRDGRKVGKKPAFTVWQKMTVDDRRAAFADIRDRNNAGGWGKYIKDMQRYLRDRGWEDEWQGQRVGTEPDLAADRGLSPEAISEAGLKLPLCFHQVRGPWTYFGPHPHVLFGAVIDACEACGKPSQRVRPA